MKRYVSKGRFEIEVGNYPTEAVGNKKPMKHLKIYTESPCQIDLWLDPNDIEAFREALLDDTSKEE